MAHLRAAFALLLIAALPMAGADETDADVAKGLENLKLMYGIAQAIDARVRASTYVSALQPQLDPWGTPYRIEAYKAEAGNVYRITSAGRDRTFEGAENRPRQQFTGVDGDAVLENGAMHRSNRNWLFARVAPGSAAATELEGLRKAELLFMMFRSPSVQRVAGISITSTAMREIGALIEKHRAAHGNLADLAPPYDGMGNLLASAPDQRLNRDAWGTPFQLRVEGDTWRLISAGADGKFDPASWTRPPEVDASEDIVFEKDGFTRTIDPGKAFEKLPPEAEVIAQPPDPSLNGVGPWVQVGGDVAPPVVVERIEPLYPENYRRVRITGIVILQIAVSAAGAVDDIRVLKSKAPELDMAAVTAARKWTFRPATKDGQPVPALFNLTINFTLK